MSLTHSLLVFSYFVFLSFLSATRLIFFDLLTMCDICYILEQYTQTQPPSYFLEWPNAKDGIGRFTPHSSPSATVVCIAAR